MYAAIGCICCCSLDCKALCFYGPCVSHYLPVLWMPTNCRGGRQKVPLSWRLLFPSGLADLVSVQSRAVLLYRHSTPDLRTLMWKARNWAVAAWTNRVVCFAGLLILQSAGSAANLSLFPLLATLSHFSEALRFSFRLNPLSPSGTRGSERQLALACPYCICGAKMACSTSSVLLPLPPSPSPERSNPDFKMNRRLFPSIFLLPLSLSLSVFLFLLPLSLLFSFSRPPPSKNRINLGKRIPPLYLVLLLTLPLG